MQAVGVERKVASGRPGGMKDLWGFQRYPRLHHAYDQSLRMNQILMESLYTYMG